MKKVSTEAIQQAPLNEIILDRIINYFYELKCRKYTEKT